ncbi:MAG: hypothetical protein JWQ80_828 [Massilia sp.]|nr:hypothetical protein [Massilia sp.]
MVRSKPSYIALPATEYDILPSLSDTWKLAVGPSKPPPVRAPILNSRWPLRIAFFSTMLMVPATDCVENSALAARSTSMRSMTSGESESIEKPAGARSPLTRICV